MENLMMQERHLGKFCILYSHSNWIELKNTKPYSELIDPNKKLTNLAEKSEETCVELCRKGSCGAEFRKDLKVLTSGYFELLPVNKPKGKCSHGGISDSTTGLGKSWDGINKDYKESNNGHGVLHNTASNLATDATVQLLENIWKKTDNSKFLRLVGLHEEEPAGAWRTSLHFILLTSRYPDANKPDEMGTME
ncbi:von Willebrand factor A domain-containing protein 7-like isoform X2 [Myxocyprinus asiaticus]|uniref:von Willebrand factor A domain-containing protein 7-like isoform X2 n=1 Tax=Myxocyprinus asiaticus TaxID=70543 RepID=UPI002223AE99|nr:von Willebrand factor A domain-containing protein 7-like isoform X2 [Myxocyprinus asiaticus]